MDGGGAGGRRDGRKIGRSRVTLKSLTGIAHSGLALSGRCSAGGLGAAGGILTSTTTGLAASIRSDGTEPFAFGPPIWSSKGSEMADVADAPVQNGKTAIRIWTVYLRTVILPPATVQRHQA